MAKITVSIARPVKIGAQIYMPGQAEVDADTADALGAAGVLGSGDEPATAGDELAFASMSGSEINRLIAERDAAITRAEAAEAQVAELERQRDTSTKAADADPPPVEKAQKEGAAPKG